MKKGLKFEVIVLKYFLLMLVGCTLAYGVGKVLELSLLTTAIAVVVDTVLVRSLILLACLGVLTAITESLRSGSQE